MPPAALEIIDIEPKQGETWFATLPIEVHKAKSGGENVRTFVISTSEVDRDGDILEPSGVQIENYMKNPQVLWAHDYRSHPIGRATRLQVAKSVIESDVEFAPTAFAQETKMLLDLGFLPASSVGFLPMEWKIRDPNQSFSTTQDDIDAGVTRRIKKGYHFTKWELLEWSIVPVPANPGALIVAAKGKGINLPGIEEMLATMAAVTKPGLDETADFFHYQLRDPKDFDSIKTIQLKKTKPRISARVGRLKGETKTTLQGLLFPKKNCG